MLIRIRRSWDIPEREATPEHIFLDRRAFMAGSAAIAATGLGLRGAAAAGEPADPSARPLPPPSGTRPTRSLGDTTPEAVNTNYNNFYEYGTSKHVADAAQMLKVRPLDREVHRDGPKSPRRWRSTTC